MCPGSVTGFGALSLNSKSSKSGRFVILLIWIELGEDIDKFTHATDRQRLAGIQQRLVVGDPGLSLRQFIYRRSGSNDLGDGHIIGSTDHLGNVVPRPASRVSWPYPHARFLRCAPPAKGSGGRGGNVLY
jgi:hypothetical protein